MFGTLKRQWHDLRKARPGERFERRYNARKGRRSAVWKPIYLIAGTLLTLAGFVLLPAPGPGFIVVFFGAAMLAEESLWVARALDWTEVRLRRVLSRARRLWRSMSAAVKAVVALCGAAIAAAAGVTAYTLMF